MFSYVPAALSYSLHTRVRSIYLGKIWTACYDDFWQIQSTILIPEISLFLKLKLTNKPVLEIRKKKIIKHLTDYKTKSTIFRQIDYFWLLWICQKVAYQSHLLRSGYFECTLACLSKQWAYMVSWHDKHIHLVSICYKVQSTQFWIYKNNFFTNQDWDL